MNTIPYKRLKWLFLFIIAWLCLLFGLKLGYIALLSQSNTFAYLAAEKAIAGQNEGTFYERDLDYLDRWIAMLEMEESGGNDLVEIIDSNGLVSAGCMQFQFATFKEQARKYDILPYTEDVELENLWRDCSLQKELTRRMLLDDVKNCRHWYTSVYIKGLQEPELFDSI